MGEALSKLIERQAQFLQTDYFVNIEAAAVERARTYPKSFAQYQALPAKSKLITAMNIYEHEAPRYYVVAGKMPDNPFTFDITDISDGHVDRAEAQIVFVEGSDAETPQPIANENYPTLRIYVKSYVGHGFTTGELARVKLVQELGLGMNLTDVNPTDLFFEVEGYELPTTRDVQDPLFKEIIGVIDRGIGVMYENRLDARIAPLGGLAIANQE